MEKETTIRDPSIPVIVYYKARGHAQIIRSILLEIGVPFQEVYVSCEHGIPEDIAQQYNLTMKNIPYLIHENQVITQKLGIIRYCCCRFGRGDLLGIGSLNQIKIIQALINYMAQKSRILNWIISMGALWGKYNLKEQNKDQNSEQIKQSLLKKLKELKYFQALKRMFMKSNGYLFGHLTILDFIFHQACFDLIGILGDRLREDHSVLFLYREFFQRTEFYVKNKEELESYKMIVPDVPIIVNKIFSEIWEGDKKFVCDCWKQQQH